MKISFVMSPTKRFLRKIRCRMEDIDDLIAEKAVYQRIDENAKRVLTEIGINISENQPLWIFLWKPMPWISTMKRRFSFP
jgi:hypothetical protein